MRVLVVEDDGAVREMLRDLLIDGGHVVTTAASFTEAAALLAKPQWDVLLSDLVLPGGSGYDLAEQARARGLGAVVCSGHPARIEELPGRGIARLVKPFSPAELDAALASVAPPSTAATPDPITEL